MLHKLQVTLLLLPYERKMGNDNLLLLKRQFSLLLGKCSWGSVFLSTQRQINRFWLRTQWMKCSTAGNIPLLWFAAPLGCPHLAQLTVGGWVNTEDVMDNLGSADLIAGKTPLFSPNTGLQEHLCPRAQQPAPASACSFAPASGTLLSWSDDSEKNKLDK